MIHLFNEVFVEQESKITIFPVYPNAQVQESVYSVCVISPTYNTPDLESNPTCIFLANSLSHLYEKYEWSGMEDFLRALMLKDGKVVIYASNEEMAEIVATVLKSLTNMEQQQMKTYVATYKWKNLVNARHFGNLYDFMLTKFADAPAIDFSDADFIPSYEFLLATAFNNTEFAKKDKLKYLLAKFIKREYEEVILEVRNHIDDLILDKDVQLTLGGTNYVSNIDISTIKDQLPKLQVYKAPYFTEELYAPQHKAYRPGSYSRGESKINISLCTPEELEELTTFTEDFLYLAGGSTVLTKETLSQFYESRGWTYKDSAAAGTLTDAEYVAVINEMLQEQYYLRFVPLDLRETIMLQIITHFKTLKNTNNSEELQKYTLK